MSYTSSRSRYLENELLNRPKEWLVPLLYEHLLVNLNRAAVQMEMRDIEGKSASLTRAMDILMELSGSLDHDQGGAIAGQLSALYSFFASEIMAVGRNLDAARLRKNIAIIAELHDAWVKAAEQVAPRGALAGAAA